MILGYIVNYQNFDAWKFISTMNKQRIEEADIDGSDVVSGSTILLETYSKLLCAIEANAKKIDSIYRDEGQNLRKFKLKKLFQTIDPLIFNFIVFSTMSRRERNCILSSDSLTQYANGEIPCLETYHKESQRSHALFVRRVCLSIELIFVRVRGELCNPLSFMITDIVNKYSGSVILLQALNQTTNITYSHDTYMRLRYIEIKLC